MTHKLVKLGSVASFVSGYPFASAAFNSDGRGMPIVRIRDVKQGATNTYYDGDYDSRYIVNRGDYLIGMDGEFNLAQWRSAPALLNQRVCKIDYVSDGLDRHYLARFLPAVLKRIEDATPFATVKHLSVKTLRDIDIPLPPLSVQRNIAAVLDQVDALRTKRREGLALLDKLVQSIFMDMFGDPTVRTPKFPMRPLAEVLVRPLQNGAYYPKDSYVSNGGFEMVHMGDAFYGIVERGSLKRVHCPTSDLEKYGLDSSDILVARRSLNFEGSVKPCLVPESQEPLVFESSLIRVTPDPEIVSTLYMYHYLANDRVREHFIFPFVTGATISGISQANLARVPVMVPEVRQQKEFEARLVSVQALRESYESQLAELDALFASIQYRAFRGEL